LKMIQNCPNCLKFAQRTYTATINTGCPIEDLGFGKNIKIIVQKCILYL